MRAGLFAQLVLYGGLASARVLSLVLVGTPNALGIALHAVELAGLTAALLGWRALARAGGSSEPGSGFDSPAGFALERAGPEALRELLPLVSAFQREAGYASGDAALGAAVSALLRDERAGAVLVLRQNGAAVGYAALCLGFSIEFRGRDAFVDEIYLSPAQRGCGLGRVLLRALEAQARALNVRQLHLEVEQHNAGARRLYAREGFAATGRELLSQRLG